MKKIKYIFFTLILSIAIIGCSSKPEQENLAPEPTEEIAPEPTPVPPTPTSEPEVVSQCIECHTDKDRLISTAKAEEEVISENEGAG